MLLFLNRTLVLATFLCFTVSLFKLANSVGTTHNLIVVVQRFVVKIVSKGPQPQFTLSVKFIKLDDGFRQYINLLENSQNLFILLQPLDLYNTQCH